MKHNLKLGLLAAMALGFLVSCNSAERMAGGYNPLDDFEQLNPASIFATPEPLPSSNYSTEQLGKGRYLVSLLGCGSCHTDGALAGEPDADRLLAGSDTGIAYKSIHYFESGHCLSGEFNAGHGNRVRSVDYGAIGYHDSGWNH